MIVAVAGLPGVGKSALARALAARCDAVVLDRDHFRASLFPPSRVDYSREQNDFCLDIVYRTTAWLLRRDRSTVVIIDGCTYVRAGQVEKLRQLGADLGEQVRILECVCTEEIAVARIEADRAAGRHPAANRDPALYRELRAAAEPISQPKLIVDTTRPLATCVVDCSSYLKVTTSPKSVTGPTKSR